MKKQIIKLTEQDIHNMVKNTINKIIKENNYKSKIHKINAALHAAGKGHEANDTINNMLAKQQAINDINKDIQTRQNRVPKKQWDGMTDLDRYRDWIDYHVDSNNKFVNGVNYNDLNITPEYGEDMLTVDY